MPILFKYNDHTVDVDDVPLDVYADIEKRTGVTWYQLAGRPMAHAAAGQMLAKECARIAGVTLPEPLTPAVFIALWDVVEESNLPAEYSDGLPDPKAAGSDPETT